MISLREFNQLKVGSKVVVRPAFGTFAPITVTVKHKELHNGKPIIDYVNGDRTHWAYMRQIVSIVSIGGK